MRTVMWGIILLAFPCVGFLMGWLVGFSQSPVVGTVLPIVFGLIGAMGFGAIERRAFRQRLSVMTDGLGEAARAEVLSKLRPEDDSTLEGPAAWSFGTILFCAACFWGVRVGVDERSPSYPPLAGWIARTDLSPEEQALLHSIRWNLMARGVSVPDAEAFFEGPVAACLVGGTEFERFDRLAQVHEHVRGGQPVGRHVANRQDPPIPRMPDLIPS